MRSKKNSFVESKSEIIVKKLMLSSSDFDRDFGIIKKIEISRWISEVIIDITDEGI